MLLLRCGLALDTPSASPCVSRCRPSAAYALPVPFDEAEIFRGDHARARDSAALCGFGSLSQRERLENEVAYRQSRCFDRGACPRTRLQPGHCPIDHVSAAATALCWKSGARETVEIALRDLPLCEALVGKAVVDLDRQCLAGFR